MTIGGGGCRSQRAPEREPGMTIETFPEEIVKKYLEEYWQKHPQQLNGFKQCGRDLRRWKKLQRYWIT